MTLSRSEKNAAERVRDRNAAMGSGSALGLLNGKPVPAELDVTPAQLPNLLPAKARIRESIKDLDEILANSAREQAEEGGELARQHGLEARAESVESAAGVWRALIEATVTLGAGVVVAGSRGRGAVASTLLGSVSSGLVHNAELPVLIVPSLSAAP